MTAAHWLLLAAFAGFAVLVVLLRWRWPRLRASDAEPRGPEAIVEPQDRTAEVMFDRHVDDALVLLSERDQAIAEHTDKAMRRLAGDYKCGTDGPCIHTGHDHLTVEEAADCPTCSPSGLPRRIEGGDEHA